VRVDGKGRAETEVGSPVGFCSESGLNFWPHRVVATIQAHHYTENTKKGDGKNRVRREREEEASDIKEEKSLHSTNGS